MIENTVDKPYYERMYRRVRGSAGRRMKKVRSATVELELGTLVHFQGMRKVYTKGIGLANKQVLLACTAYNVKKLMRFKVINSVAKDMKLMITKYDCGFEKAGCFGSDTNKYKNRPEKFTSYLYFL
jgi:hypothetical protein